MSRISEEFHVGKGDYKDLECEYIIDNDIDIYIYFYKDGKLQKMLKHNGIFPTEHLPIFKDEKIYVPLKLIKEQLGYEVVIPQAPEPKVDKTKKDTPIVPVKGTKLGYISINEELCPVRYIEKLDDNLVNLSDYARYIPCLWTYDGKYISITTQEFLLKQRNVERLKYIEGHGHKCGH